MTEEEKIILNQLADVWNAFIKLEVLHECDRDEFCRSIHAAQNIIMARVALRQFQKEKA